MNSEMSLPMRFLLWSAWPLLLAPLTILLHELGHFLTAMALGFEEAQLHFSHVEFDEAGGRSPAQVGLVGLAGPLVTAAQILAAMAFHRLRPESRWPYALAVAAASRFVVGVPYTIIGLIVRARGERLQPPAFDEFRAGEALGWSGDLLLGLSSLMVLVTLVWLARALPRGERSAAWPGLLLGTIGGWALWFSAGPLILP
jgi:hypothetical protein